MSTRWSGERSGQVRASTFRARSATASRSRCGQDTSIASGTSATSWLTFKMLVSAGGRSSRPRGRRPPARPEHDRTAACLMSGHLARGYWTCAEEDYSFEFLTKFNRGSHWTISKVYCSSKRKAWSRGSTNCPPQWVGRKRVGPSWGQSTYSAPAVFRTECRKRCSSLTQPRTGKSSKEEKQKSKESHTCRHKGLNRPCHPPPRRRGPWR